MHESEDLQCLFKCFEESYKCGVPCAWNLFPKEDVRSFESSGQPVVICRNNLVDMPQVVSKTVGELTGQDSFLRLIRPSNYHSIG